MSIPCKPPPCGAALTLRATESIMNPVHAVSQPHLPLHCRKRRTVRPPPPRTPEAVDGRRHIDIQTDTYLEELTDTVPEADNQTQTDAFLDRPPTPIFVPQKSGVDVTTQIENGG
eukprot:1160427-Pelagomonas_calceolata.AAC.5